MPIDIWNQYINTPDVSESFPEILSQVCQNLHHILINDVEEDTDIENTHIVITYRIERKKKTKRNKLKNLGKYHKIQSNETHKTCPICLDTFKSGKYKRKMPKCSHEFHKSCIDKWLYNDKHFRCPICRTFQGNNSN